MNQSIYESIYLPFTLTLADSIINRLTKSANKSLLVYSSLSYHIYY